MATEKETTAPIPSVAPDGEQPSALARNDSIPFLEEKNKSSDGMTVIPMPKLMEIRFPASEVQHPLQDPPQQGGEDPPAAVGRCTVVYGMYGK